MHTNDHKTATFTYAHNPPNLTAYRPRSTRCSTSDVAPNSRRVPWPLPLRLEQQLLHRPMGDGFVECRVGSRRRQLLLLLCLEQHPLDGPGLQRSGHCSRSCWRSTLLLLLLQEVKLHPGVWIVTQTMTTKINKSSLLSEADQTQNTDGKTLKKLDIKILIINQ